MEKKKSNSSKNNAKNRSSQFEKLAWGWFWLGFAIALIYLTFVILKHININSDFDIINAGAFGDLIGGVVGSFWALTGVFLFYQALQDQRKDFQTNMEILNLQRQDYKSQLDEAILTRSTLNKQTEHLWRQQFESTFFNMMKVHDDIRRSIRADSTMKVTKHKNRVASFSEIRTWQGLEFFKEVEEDWRQFYWIGHGLESEYVVKAVRVEDFVLNPVEKDLPLERPLNRIQEKYKIFFGAYQNFLGHYFRQLYHILKFLELSEENSPPGDLYAAADKDHDDLSNYARILQSQLSSAELTLLFYNGLCFQKMFHYLNKYQMLNNLSLDRLADPERHKGLYPAIEFLKLEELFDEKKVTEEDMQKWRN